MQILKIKLSIFLILSGVAYLINCNEANLKSKNIEENNPINNAINVQINGQKKDSFYPLHVKLMLFTEFPKMNDYPEYNNSNYSFVGIFKDNKINLKVNKGNYFGIIEIHNNQHYPLIFSNLARIQIKFGFYYETVGFTNHQIIAYKEDKCIWKNLSFENREIICPPLLIDNNHKLNLVFDIEEKAKFSESKTAAIWVSAVYGSLYTFSPAGLAFPILLGPVAVERKIESNLLK